MIRLKKGHLLQFVISRFCWEVFNFVGIYLLTKQSLKIRKENSLTEQWGYEVDLFALEFDFCVICLLNYIFIMYYDDNEKNNIVLFIAK